LPFFGAKYLILVCVIFRSWRSTVVLSYHLRFASIPGVKLST